MFWREIDSDDLEKLDRDGYVIVDDFIEDFSKLETMRDELRAIPISESGFDSHVRNDSVENDSSVATMRPNRTHFLDKANNRRFLFSKPGVYEYDMHESSSADGASMETLKEFFAETGKFLANAFNAAMNNNEKMLNSLRCKPGCENRTVKLQINKSGAFPYHIDNPGGSSNVTRRKLTCILYLNEEYEDVNGGEIVLVPFMGNFINVRPLFNRLCVFKSESMLHRVNKANGFKDPGRLCLTIWLDGDDNLAKEDPREIRKNLIEKKNDKNSLIAYIRESPDAQRFCSRFVYRDEYEVSLLDSHDNDNGCEKMLDAHSNAVKELRRTNDEELLNVLELLRQMRHDFADESFIRL
jgi:hypothetical protein